MALSIGNTDTRIETGSSGVSFTFTNNGNLLLVFIGRPADMTAPSVTYNGQALSQATTWLNNASGSSGWFYLNNAPQGSYTLATSHSNNAAGTAVLSIIGAHGTLPIGGTGSNATNAKTVSVSVTSQSLTSLLLQGEVDGRGEGVSSFGANETQIFSQDSLVTIGLHGSKKAGTASGTTMSTTIINVSNITAAVVEILPASSVPSGMFLMF